MNHFPEPSTDPGIKRRSVTFSVVVLCHLLVFMGPVLLTGIISPKKPKDNMFRVKIGGEKLSHGPMVGMPERTPPPKVPSEPEVPVSVPEPKIPVRPQRRVAEPAVPVVKPKPKPRPKVKPAKKQVKRRKITPRKKRKPAVPAVKPKPKPETPRKIRKKTVRRSVKKRNPMDDVYRPRQQPNINPSVPIGNRNRAQKYGKKADNRAPGGGKQTDETAFVHYGRNIERYIYSRWSEPPRSLLRGTFPETMIEVTIEANGRVSAAKVVKSSGNAPMEESVKALIAGLDLLPRPPAGRITFRISLKTR